MTRPITFSDYSARVREFIARHERPSPPDSETGGAGDSSEFNALALALFALQFEHVSPYRRFCQGRGRTPKSVTAWAEIPAIPAVAFKEFDLTSLAIAERAEVFYSSGTTTQRPSRHYHSAESLALYEASLRPWFARHLLPSPEAGRADLQVRPASFRQSMRVQSSRSALSEIESNAPGAEIETPQFIILSPPPALAPHSSLVHMFETLRREFAKSDALFCGKLEADGAWSLDAEMMAGALQKSTTTKRPVVLLGTAFLFVYWLDYGQTKNLRYELPGGSRLLETGGYKGRSRALPKEELHASLTRQLGIPRTQIVCEYGMSELSSQAYDGVAGSARQSATAVGESKSLPLTRPSGTLAPSVGEGRGEEAHRSAASDTSSQIANEPSLKFEAGGRRFRFPAWARVQIISPETGREVAEGETGLIRVFDLANVRSVMALQTEDLGIRRTDGFELIGRADPAEPRGCSLMSR